MKKVYLFTIAFISVLGFSAHAQTAEPALLITWSVSRSSAPPDFQGKILPGAQSTISASVALIDKGRAVNLSGETIQWYANNNFIDGGVGVTSVSFGATQVAPNTIDLRAQLPFYKSGYTVKTIEIPVVRPEAVIDAPLPRGIFIQSPLKLKARAFFFTVPDLSFLRFSWNVNGAEPTNQENPDNLLINVPTGTANGSSFSTSLSVENPFSFGQQATRQITTIFKK